ncbi:MAG: hypothetical protein EOP48_00080 [Sphingobacteriales bacterium]|nr:MAG: hypothetical protein EOP48_00080 [Sphingobacteriales bacterium]
MEKVIFDTNAYRYLVSNVKFEEIDKMIEKLHSKEKIRGIQSLMSPIVITELLAHVADKKDSSFEKCLKALKAVYLHNSEEDQYRILASPEMLIAKAFFNEELMKKEESIKAMVQIAFHLSKKPNPYNFKKFQRTLTNIKNHVSNTELFFANALKELVTQSDPESKTWRIFPNNQKERQKVLKGIRSDDTSNSIAAGLILPVYDLLVNENKIQKITVETLQDMSQEFVKMFPEYIALYKLVFENLVNSEFNMLEDSRSNFIWDIQLMLNIGNHSVDNEKLYFVTADKAIISTAIGQNAKYSILNFDEYLDYIN